MLVRLANPNHSPHAWGWPMGGAVLLLPSPVSFPVTRPEMSLIRLIHSPNDCHTIWLLLDLVSFPGAGHSCPPLQACPRVPNASCVQGLKMQGCHQEWHSSPSPRNKIYNLIAWSYAFLKGVHQPRRGLPESMKLTRVACAL